MTYRMDVTSTTPPDEAMFLPLPVQVTISDALYHIGSINGQCEDSDPFPTICYMSGVNGGRPFDDPDDDGEVPLPIALTEGGAPIIGQQCPDCVTEFDFVFGPTQATGSFSFDYGELGGGWADGVGAFEFDSFYIQYAGTLDRVAEPSSGAVLGLALAGLLASRRRKVITRSI
ncbi:MAG: PEP-CTERM sorting domain-containing protein [Acetobacteraceae bacterium]